MRRLSLIAVLLGLLVLPTGASAAVPKNFVGMMVDGPLFPVTASGVNLSSQMDKMVASGVETIRVVFDWAAAQPYHHWKDVPPADAGQFTDLGGIPTRLGEIDQLMSLAAAHGLTVLPVVIYTPGWDAAPHPPTAFATPKRLAPYANFVKAMVKRYGPRGTFWQGGGPKVPIRSWQIWNEPNIRTFWPQRPFIKTYVRLLHAAHDAIRSADRHAKVVLAGMPNYSWVQIKAIYKIHGARNWFDVVALHPYTAKPQGVITIIQRVRNVMNSAGDRRKPIVADEISWPSSRGRIHSGGKFDVATTERGQARNIAQLLPMLATERHKLGLIGFDYYTWAGVERSGGIPFDFAGLFRFKHGDFIAKPAYFSFRKAALALEGCKRKGAVATACARRA